jgi:hypothetical protein
MPEGSQPAYEITLAHFIVSDDVERSRRFYTEVLGGKTIRSGEPTYVALANSWIIINSSSMTHAPSILPVRSLSSTTLRPCP